MFVLGTNISHLRKNQLTVASWKQKNGVFKWG